MQNDAEDRPLASLEAAIETAKQFFRDNPDAEVFTCVVPAPTGGSE